MGWFLDVGGRGGKIDESVFFDCFCGFAGFAGFKFGPLRFMFKSGCLSRITGK